MRHYPKPPSELELVLFTNFTDYFITILFIYACTFPLVRAAQSDKLFVTAKIPKDTASKEIPKHFSIPPPIMEPKTIETFRCRKQVFHDGKMLNYDVNINTNCDNLLPLMEGTPESKHELKQYQIQQTKLGKMVYFTSLGAAIAILGFATNITATENSPHAYRLSSDLLLASGIWLGLNSFFYNISVFRQGSEHFHQAVQHYNHAHPRKPIELRIELPLGD